MKSVDCVVVGGGMVGAASALSLAQLGLSVVLVEKMPPPEFSLDQPIDLRVSAISLASEQLLRQLGAWPEIAASRIVPYRRLGVWETELAYTEFDARSIRQPCLGHIIENKLIQSSLWQQIALEPNIEVLCSTNVNAIDYTSREGSTGNLVITQLDDFSIEAKIVVAADGVNSQIRQMSGIGSTGWQYQQSAMLIHVETELEQQDITWQQFTPTGPVAMLPLSGKQASLVWYHDQQKIKKLAALSNDALTEQVMLQFPARLGKVKVLNKASFPLKRQHANQYVSGRVVLLGDAAHSINPLAGQGVNLGFKDVKALQSVIATAIGEGQEWSNSEVLMEYEKRRRLDNALMMTTMDALYKGFSNQSPLLKLVRNAGLFVAQRVPILKSKALEYACGIT
jgi:3-demethoxyubiquinol 3-hydroxylase